jgi:hypothetical protein
VKGHENLVLSKKEAELVKETARIYGISEEEAATLIVKASIARRMKKRTGKAPARVYDIKRR